ncbi:MAG TPA: DUF167 domain-containing protein [Gemmatimonadales bacterium]|nr:DUF167 domain-containing protein [Gemmatimonadales bacterium]
MSTVLSSSGDGVVIAIRLQPRAAQSGILGVVNGALRIRVTAPPVEGAANEALVKLLAARLGVAPSKIEIRSGERGRNKVVLIRGVTARLAEDRLGIAGPGGTDPQVGGRR